MRSRPANPPPQVVPRSPAYGASTYSPSRHYSGAVHAGMPYADPNYPSHPPPVTAPSQHPTQPPPPNYPNPSYSYPPGSVSPGHGAMGYQQPPAVYQQGYEAVDQQYDAAYDMTQPHYSGVHHLYPARVHCIYNIGSSSTFDFMMLRYRKQEAFSVQSVVPIAAVQTLGGTILVCWQSFMPYNSPQRALALAMSCKVFSMEHSMCHRIEGSMCYDSPDISIQLLSNYSDTGSSHIM